MSVARRVLLVAAIAALAVVPLRAFGVVGGGSSGLSVSASLAGCGAGGEGIACTINVSFTGVEGADHYTATVTRADGSVQDLGTVGSGEGGGSAVVTVPYVGAGSYSVTVSAWGEPDEEGGEPKLLEREDSDTTEREQQGAATPEGGAAEDAPQASSGEGEPADEESPGEFAPAEPPAEPPTQSLPECRPDAAPAEAPAPMDDGGESPEAQAAPPPQPPAPVVECTAPSSDSNGPCCPPGA